MKKFCLIQHPKKTSLSNIVYNKYFKICNLPYTYKDITILPENFNYSINNILIKYDGINVTVPFKEKVVNFLELSDSAKLIGAVNCIYKNIGYNTDYLGFKNSLNNTDIPSKITVLGAGGVSKAIIFGLYKLGVKKITLLNRTLDRAYNLQTLFSKYIKIHVEPFSKLNEVLSNTEFLINATSIGMFGETLIIPKSNNIQLFYDSVYYKTPLQELFKKRNVYTINGKTLWFYQAIENLKIWKIYTSNFLNFNTFY